MTDSTLDPANTGATDQPFGRHLILIGAAVIGCFLFGLGLWLVYAPISSVVTAPGIVQADAARQTVQHLHGGIVSEVLVRNGSVVQTGDPLIRLQDTRQRSHWKQLRAQYFDALAQVARIYAERAEQTSILFPIELQEQAADEDAQIAMAAQRNLFGSRQQSLRERREARQQRLAALNTEVNAISRQIQAGEKQLAISQSLIEHYRNNSATQASAGNLLEFELDQARIEAELGAMTISLARTQRAKLETQLDYQASRVLEQKRLEQELRDYSARVYDLQQQLDVADDELQRMTVRAHADGEVMGLKLSNPGDVVSPGQTLMVIVPAYDSVIVDAAITGKEIDRIQLGSDALVELALANHRRANPIEGTVKWLSAQQFSDPISGQTYYKAHIALNKSDLHQQDLVLQPGMAANVMIRTAARSPIDYLLAPISRNFDR